MVIKEMFLEVNGSIWNIQGAEYLKKSVLSLKCSWKLGWSNLDLNEYELFPIWTTDGAAAVRQKYS